MMDVLIVGGGTAGLVAAMDLVEQGYSVAVYEKEPVPGGLAAAVEFDNHIIDKYYHFLCGGDHDWVELCRRLGIEDRLEWRDSHTSIFYNGRLYPLAVPLDLLCFSPVDILSRIRIGINAISSRFIHNWRCLDGITAKEWLISRIGLQAYEVIWDPLLRIKFGRYYDQISAAWVWHRIFRLAESRKGLFEHEKLGYLQGGMQTLWRALLARIESRGGKVITGAAVDGIIADGDRVAGVIVGKEVVSARAVLSAVPLPVLAGLLPAGQRELADKLCAIDFIGVVCAVLKIKGRLTDSFWINTNDPGIAFNGFIEYSNLNPGFFGDGSGAVYVPFYLEADSDRFNRSDKSLIEEYVGALGRVRPGFSADDVEVAAVYRDRYAQAVCTAGFAGKVPPHAAPLKGLYLIDSTQLYPSDRTVSGTIGLAHDAVAIMSRWMTEGGIE
jgi:protoporphyrinogen oxidase